MLEEIMCTYIYQEARHTVDHPWSIRLGDSSGWEGLHQTHPDQKGIKACRCAGQRKDYWHHPAGSYMLFSS
jgi:hypothetical protein